MPNMKKVRYKPKLFVSVKYGRHLGGDSAAAAAVVVMHPHPRAIPLAMITMRKSIHGFPYFAI